MELCIGTAQFGISYGVANSYKKVSKEDSQRILEHAFENGISFIDTASTYGNAEEVIGQIKNLDEQFKIISKSPNIPNDHITALDSDILIKSVFNSIEKLGISSLYAVLLHHGHDLLKPGGAVLFEALKDLRQNGVIKKIGVSVYDRFEIEAIIQQFDFDIIQVPMNILDQRLLQDNLLVDLKNSGIEIDVRSVFLQGVLLMNPKNLPPFFNVALDTINNLRNDITAKNLNMIDACLGFVKSVDFISRIIVGVNSVSQLNEICESFQKDCSNIDYPKYSFHDENVLNPSRWPL